MIYDIARAAMKLRQSSIKHLPHDEFRILDSRAGMIHFALVSLSSSYF